MKKEINKQAGNDFMDGVLLACLLLGIVLLLTSCNSPTGAEQTTITQEKKIEQEPIKCSSYTLVWEADKTHIGVYIGSFKEPTGQTINDILTGGYDYLIMTGEDLRYEDHIGLVDWQQCPEYKDYIGME